MRGEGNHRYIILAGSRELRRRRTTSANSDTGSGGGNGVVVGIAENDNDDHAAAYPASVASDGSPLALESGHHTMEFFEMCAALITQLAR